MLEEVVFKLLAEKQGYRGRALASHCNNFFYGGNTLLWFNFVPNFSHLKSLQPYNSER